MENGANYRSAIIAEPNLMPPGGLAVPTTSVEPVLRTPFVGNVRALAPPLPQPPMQLPYASSGNYCGGFSSAYGNYFGNNFGGYGGGFGGFSGYGTYNRFGGNGSINPSDPEARFIQIAEANSRAAFQSIESLVSAIGNIASMLDSTFFALTSSFHAILGVAANFGRLRGVFAKLWHTFAIIKTLTFIYKKILYWLHISNLDPSSAAFQKAFSEAMNEAIPSGSKTAPLAQKGPSPWPVLAFISFIFTAPYLIMKLLGAVSSTVQEDTRSPIKWMNPIETVAIYDFHSRNQNELTFYAGQRLLIAPKEIQQAQGLLNTGWGLATIDGTLSGIVPINYIKSLQQLVKERESARLSEDQQTKGYLPSDQMKSDAPVEQSKPDLTNINDAAAYTASQANS